MMRKELTHPDFVNALEEVDEKLSRRMLQKGMGTYASIHEILGIVQEEVTEYQEEVHAKNDREAQVQELIDIAVGAIWGIASIRSGGVDWWSDTINVRRKDVALYDEWAAGPMDLKYQYWLERRIIDLESKLDPFYWTQAESDAWHRTIPDVRKAFQKLREVER